MKLTADQYHFCMLEEPAMFKPLSYSSEFVNTRQSLVLSTDNASFKAKKYTSRQSRYIYVNGTGPKTLPYRVAKKRKYVSHKN